MVRVGLFLILGMLLFLLGVLFGQMAWLRFPTYDPPTYSGLSPHQKHKQSMFDAEIEVDLVFFGDSHIEAGLWSEWYPELKVANRGIMGDRTETLLARIQNSKVQAKVALLMIGTNDLYYGVEFDEIVSNYLSITSALKSKYPKVVIHSIPLTHSQKSNLNGNIQKLNARIAMIAQSRHLSFFDLSQAVEQEGELDPKYSEDGLHLNGQGYQVWVNQLQRFMISPP